jgi:hypothetical protein
MLCLRYSQFLFEIARGNGHETEFANGVEGAVRVVAVRENRYVAEHLVSSLYAQDRNYGTSPQPKASARIQIVTDTEVLEKRGGLNRSVQHWLAVYSPEFQSPRFFAGVD